MTLLGLAVVMEPGVTALIAVGASIIQLLPMRVLAAAVVDVKDCN